VSLQNQPFSRKTNKKKNKFEERQLDTKALKPMRIKTRLPFLYLLACKHQNSIHHKARTFFLFSWGNEGGDGSPLLY